MVLINRHLNEQAPWLTSFIGILTMSYYPYIPTPLAASFGLRASALASPNLTTPNLTTPNLTTSGLTTSGLTTPKVAKQGLAPIGLFDSGMGGLSVYLHLKQRLPDERYVYYADTLNVPYGNRPHAQIVQLTLAAVDRLVTTGCKLIVIACNSASAHALQIARQHYPHIPIVGLVPALKPAVLQSRTRRVAVLATQATLEGALLNQVIADYATPNAVTVIKHFDPSLVPWVEQGMPPYAKTARQLIETLHQFAAQQVDYLVLGCTHYPFFRPFLTAEIMAKNMPITVVDSGAAVADRVHAVLKSQHKLAPAPKPTGIRVSNLQFGQTNIKGYQKPAQKIAANEVIINDTGQHKAEATNSNNKNDVVELYVNTTEHLGTHGQINTSVLLSFYVTDTHCRIDNIYQLVQRLTTS